MKNLLPAIPHASFSTSAGGLGKTADFALSDAVHGRKFADRLSCRFQQLELKHVEDRGCSSALEFR